MCILCHDCGTASYSDYLNTLGELEGLSFSIYSCDVNIVVGDFNVDFDCGSHLASLLLDFMAWWLLISVLTLVLGTLMKVIVVLVNP